MRCVRPVKLRHDVGARAKKLSVRIEHADAPEPIPVEPDGSGVVFVPVKTKGRGIVIPR